MAGRHESMDATGAGDDTVAKIKSFLQRSDFDGNSYISGELRTELRINFDDHGAVYPETLESSLEKAFERMADQMSLCRESIQEDVSIFDEAVMTADQMLAEELIKHEARLNDVKATVGKIQGDLGRIIGQGAAPVPSDRTASLTGVQVGAKLASVERERSRIETAIELMGLVREFQSAPISKFSDLHGMEGKLIRNALPDAMKAKGKTWGDISQTLHNLRRVLVDINAGDVQTAQANVLRASEAVEGELLTQFELAVAGLTLDITDRSLLRKSREFALWLHYFNEGEALHKRYIYSVVERRLPKTVFRADQSQYHKYRKDQTEERRRQRKYGGTWGRIKKISDEAAAQLNKVKDAAGPLGKELQGISKGLGIDLGGKHDDEEDEDNDDEDDDTDLEDYESSAGASSAGGSDAGGGDDDEGGAEEEKVARARSPSRIKTTGAKEKDKGTEGSSSGPQDNKTADTGKQATSSSPPPPANANTAKSFASFLGGRSKVVASGKPTAAAQADLASNSVPLLVDHLSELFGSIGGVCKEQFEVIRKVFPPAAVARVTRQLIQRIFCDQAFGIQARVEAVLSPRPPLEPLTLPDYLDALTTVREKLNSLYLILLEYCSHPALMGLGDEHVGLTYQYSNTRSSAKRTAGSGISNLNLQLALAQGEEEEDSEEQLIIAENERLKSEAAIKAFLQEQVQQILQPYIDDYFDKEITHTRLAQVDGLRRAVGGDQSLISKVHIVHNPWPTLRAERLKGIHGMVCTVANRRYLESVFSLTTDSVVRMEGIGRGDKRLPVKIKELFDWHLGFLAESVLIPVAKTASTLLLKYAATSTQSTDLPPLEFVAVLESIYWAAGRLKTHFEEVFAAPMSEIPSLAAVCKESRRTAMRILEALIREALQAFTLGISMHISKVLAMIQSKYDYAPQLDAVTMGITKMAYAAGVAGGDVGYEGSGMDPSGKVKGASQACCHACYAVIEVIKYVRSQQAGLLSLGLNMKDNFWRPLGQQLMGIIITHIRKQRITQDGAKVLLRDLDEFLNLTAAMGITEIVDMVVCLKEITKALLVPPEDVVKVVLEDLNHLDVAVVLGVVRSRSDWSPTASSSAGWGASAQHWTRVLSSVFGAGAGTAAGGGDIWERPLPWEGQRITIMSFAETAATAAKGLTQSLGPRTLRKSSHMITPARMSEIVRASLASSKGVIIAPPGRADAAKAAKEKREKEMRAKALALQKAKAIAALRAKSQVTAAKGKVKGGNEEERAKAKAAALLDKDKVKKATKADGAISETNKAEGSAESASESKQTQAQGGGSTKVNVDGSESSKSKASSYASAAVTASGKSLPPGDSVTSSQKAPSQQPPVQAATAKSSHSQPGASSQATSTGTASAAPSNRSSGTGQSPAAASTSSNAAPASAATATGAPPPSQSQSGVRSTAGLGFVKRETPPPKPSMMNRLSSLFGSKK